MTVYANGSVSVVTHKLIELNCTCMEAILKALSTEMNENRRNKVFTVIKQLRVQQRHFYLYPRPKKCSFRLPAHSSVCPSFRPVLTFYVGVLREVFFIHQEMALAWGIHAPLGICSS